MVDVRGFRFLIAPFRRRRISPHRFLRPLRELLVELAEWASACAAEVQDPAWQTAADALQRAADALAVVAR